jgi:hypothetical protein
MQLVAPEILAEARGLSVTITGTAFALGFLMWLFGWRGHRFWIVLAMTAGAGVIGLYSAPAYGTRPLLAGLLFAGAAGLLALALVRVVVFAAGGVAGWLLVRAVVPAWGEPLVCFLIGGLVGILLIRVWTMALTSAAGTMLMAYSGLCLANSLGNLDAVAFAENQSTILNVACGGVTLMGLFLQFLLERRRGHAASRRTGRTRSESKKEDSGRSWWDGIQFYRRAG